MGNMEKRGTKTGGGVSWLVWPFGGLILTFHLLGDGGLESLGVGTNDLANLLAALEEQEGGHGADAELLCNVGDLVDVELVELGRSELLGEPGGLSAPA